MIEKRRRATVELKHNRMLLQVRPGTTDGEKASDPGRMVSRAAQGRPSPPLIAKWEPMIGVKVERFFVRRMKTKWGSCNPDARSIRLNTDLAKKPRECLEYIVVHEMVHLLEPTHNGRFVALMDRFMPDWRFCRPS